MKNLFSKTLLCGVLATSFLLINCQKAPNRGVKADMGDQKAQQQALKMGDCTTTIVGHQNEFIKSRNELMEMVAKDSTASNSVIKEKVKQVNDLSKNLMTSIESLKVGEAKADGCIIHEDNDAKKKKTGEIIVSVVKQMRSEAGRAAKAKTKEDNVITDEDRQEEESTVREKQVLKVSEQLAAILSDSANAGGNVALVGGEIKTADANAALNDPKITACALDFKIERQDQIVKDAKMTVTGITMAKADQQRKRNVLTVATTVETKDAKGNILLSLVCNIANEKESEAPKQVRAALGNLVSNEVKSMPADNNNDQQDQKKAELEKAVNDAAEELLQAEKAAERAAADLKTAEEALAKDKENAENKKAVELAAEADKAAKALVLAAQKKADDAMEALRKLTDGGNNKDVQSTSTSGDLIQPASKAAKAQEGLEILNSAEARQ